LKNSSYHTPVLLQETIDALQVAEGEKYIDGTLGGGGHAEIILEKKGIVLGIDQDEEALTESQKRFDENDQIRIVKGNFRDIKQIAEKFNFIDSDGILFDLGTSVHQLKNELRGFSFMTHSKLDMRMDKNTALTAEEIVNSWPKAELVEIFEKYGEEPESGAIVDEIVKRRKRQKIEYTDELAEMVKSIKRKGEGKVHPATRVFQAIRIVVNDEMNVLREGLGGGLDVLRSGGRMVIISFHSLEDRIVKSTFSEFEARGLGKVIIKKPIRASFSEIKKNKKARSAKLRIFEKK